MDQERHEQATHDPTHQARESVEPAPEHRSDVPSQPPVNADGGQGQGGYGKGDDKQWSQQDYHHPAAAWGAAKSVGEVLIREREPIRGTIAMLQMNQPPKGFDCPGCAWPDDEHGLKLDLCENGVKHVTWEMTHKRTLRDFFAAHTVSELESWTDFALEDQGRLTEPMSYDPESDTYVPISWAEAFALVGDTLRSLDSPDQASFYTSGRLSNEATFLYQLWAREYGTNNLPDCSNMCHEASGRALKQSLGTGKGTADLDDWGKADALFVMGVNAASNAPRMLTSLAEAHKRGAQIVHVNPMVEAASRSTIVPHDFLDMGLNRKTQTSSLDLQVRPGGDLALMRGMAKALLERSAVDATVIDEQFLAEHTSGFDDYRRLVEETPWEDLETQAGLSRHAITKAASVYWQADRSVISWCLGVTQHEHGVSTVREIVNLLLMRGNIGRDGTGPSPVRGHSNVQGNRTCGIDHRPTEEFLAPMDAATGITSPREHGLDTVQTIRAMNNGDIKVFVSLGGNFVRAAPDTRYTEAGMRKTDLTVQVSTKLNRSHLVHGRRALILPCLGRTEKDVQKGSEQGVSVEDAMSMVHISHGRKKPASPHLRSEIAILAGMARATLPESSTPWESYVEDYDRIRDVMSRALVGFEDFNRRVRQEPVGFRIAQPARERVFKTPTGAAEFSLVDLPDVVPGPGELILQTMRSHDQWNTTIYSDSDRYRGVKNLRTLVFMNEVDMRERGLEQGQLVDITATSKDGTVRSLENYRVIAYDLPAGSAAGYMPEMNVLVGWADYSIQSDQPLMKNLRVRVEAHEEADRAHENAPGRPPGSGVSSGLRS
ncbi:molybdopterin-dependent oxidoreductase alpha subunit [Nocardioides albertanoniae]|uniref:Molybdopterin-dependent oxidoreductase alpha subunit n=1 Tax=Nocardioides albertanoniae TaxID=1175486 RepID=A0A543A621_9ACTN|nr:FdhF/YdeP family oxidoreductase [Nocardioides albertanoniae]TQL67999.1 molybdopterin-dependent oxidoreductase alpha subunit [Nocardioides albertanoniae]